MTTNVCFFQSGPKKSEEKLKATPGHFQLSYFDLRLNKPTLKVRLPKKQWKKKFSLKLANDVTVDLEKGQIQVPAGAGSIRDPEMVQSVGLAFTIATMYLLVHPKPSDIPGN